MFKCYNNHTPTERCFNPAYICTLPPLYEQQLVLTCSTGEAPRPCEPGQQPNINNNQPTCFHLLFCSNGHRCRHVKVANEPPGADVLRSPCQGKAIAGTAGGRYTPAGQPSYPAALVHTHLHQINACPLIRAGPLSQSLQHRCSRNEEESATLNHSIFALSWKKIHTDTDPDRVAKESSRGREILPFDSALSQSRSSRLSPAPTTLQNIAISSISSAWLSRFVGRLPLCFVALIWWGCSGSSRSFVSVQGASLCGFGRLRQSVRGSGGSRKQPANIDGVRGQRLTDSNPIKHRIRQPWKRAWAGSELSRAVL